MMIRCLGMGLLLAVNASARASLSEFLPVVPPGDLVPDATHFSPVEADHSIVRVYRHDEHTAWAFLTTDYVDATGYSGRPIRILVGIDTQGRITGLRLVEHHEPIVLIGIPEERVTAVLDEYIGFDVPAYVRSRERDDIDIVSGATVTITVMDDSILRASIKVARRLGLGGLAIEHKPRGPMPELDMTLQPAKDWLDLIGEGSFRRLKLNVEQINTAFAGGDDPEAARRAEPGDPSDTFIDMYAALVSIPTVGVSALGEREYRNLQQALQQGGHAILIAANGRYSFKGSGYVRGGIFDRFHLVQGDLSVRFRDGHHKRLRRVAAEGAPTFKEVDLFVLPAEASFNAAVPWQLQLLVGRATGATTKAFRTFELTYTPPANYLRFKPVETLAQTQSASSDATAEPPLWQRLWRNKTVEIAVLLVALAVLTFVFFFQDWLVRDAGRTRRVRTAFLLFTVIGIGFYANAQLSVVNILTVFNALVTGFDWAYFLMEPLIFIQWGAIAAALLFWGRGVYCGWLCPFGALQELLNMAAKKLRVPQIAVPWGVHERLWPIKYVVFLGLFGVSLHSLALSEQLAEVEPFKTAVILKFVREWPFVVFAVLLLVGGLFIERLYCRYLCVLGAALAIPGKLRMFEWLKRYNECGAPCQRCAKDCMVQAIHPEGQINPNECLYCLNCQTLYVDEHRCPVMIQKRLKREGRASGKKRDQLAELMVEFGEVKSAIDPKTGDRHG